MKRRHVALLLLVFQLGSGQAYPTPPSDGSCRSDPFPSRLVETAGLYGATAGIAPETPPLVRFKTRDGHTLNAYTYRATGFSLENGPIVFIIHGASRNARDYLNRFKPLAERHSALAIAPEFPEGVYGPGSDRFTLGVGAEKTPYTGAYLGGEWRKPEDYLYSEIEHLFEAIRLELGSRQCTYRIWGHSAGAQFVHRLLTFRSDARVASAVAVNAGWYTLPTHGSGNDSHYFMPYGLQGTPLQDKDIERLLQSPLTILAGELDTETGERAEGLRNTAAANFQGVNRRERAHFYYSMGEREARRRGLAFGWRFAIVPGAGHSSGKVGPSAAWFLFSPHTAMPCTATPATSARGLVINEIYGDPAGGLAGDANNDGVRHPQQDEFVELVNSAASDICLSGWTLSDATGTVRHRFPLGALLPSGKAMVIFGGGIPTGVFGGSTIETAVSSKGLNLNNKGDVLSLADAEGGVHQRISWGDCGGKPCAAEHIAEIDIDRSLSRRPDIHGPLAPHGGAGEELISPGTRKDKTTFDFEQ